MKITLLDPSSCADTMQKVGSKMELCGLRDFPVDVGSAQTTLASGSSTFDFIFSDISSIAPGDVFVYGGEFSPTLNLQNLSSAKGHLVIEALDVNYNVLVGTRIQLDWIATIVNGDCNPWFFFPTLMKAGLVSPFTTPPSGIYTLPASTLSSTVNYMPHKLLTVNGVLDVVTGLRTQIVQPELPSSQGVIGYRFTSTQVSAACVVDTDFLTAGKSDFDMIANRFQMTDSDFNDFSNGLLKKDISK